MARRRLIGKDTAFHQDRFAAIPYVVQLVYEPSFGMYYLDVYRVERVGN
jgi:hypothetical protein